MRILVSSLAQTNHQFDLRGCDKGDRYILSFKRFKAIIPSKTFRCQGGY